MVPHWWCYKWTNKCPFLISLSKAVWYYLYVSKAMWNSFSGSACPTLCRLLDVGQYFMMVNGTEKWFFIWKHKQPLVRKKRLLLCSEFWAWLQFRPVAVSGQWWPCCPLQHQFVEAQISPPAASAHGCCKDDDPVCLQWLWRSHCILRELRVQRHISHI